jgi:hypothetical protein
MIQDHLFLPDFSCCLPEPGKNRQKMNLKGILNERSRKTA